MIPRALYLLIGVILCSVLVSAQSKVGFHQLVSHLGKYQAADGGFVGDNDAPSADATASALLLSSLYGLNSKINTVEATKFLNSLANKDSGYSNTPGAPSTVESTRNAVVGLARLGAKAANANSTVAYLLSLLQSDTHLFAPRTGEKGDVKSTALALQAIEILGELKQKAVQSVVPAIKGALKKEFEQELFGTDVSITFYAVLAAHVVGFEVPNAAKVAKALLDLQSPQGLFYTDKAKSATSLRATVEAIAALRLLGEKNLDSVDVNALRGALRYIPTEVVHAADAHLALALTKAFRDNFVITTPHADNNVVVEGTQFRPSLSVSAKESGGVSHGGFNVVATTTFHGKAAASAKLAWNAETQSFAGEPVPTSGKFGPVDSSYALSLPVPGVGTLSFDVSDAKTVGYGISVTSKAVTELTGREVKENEQASVGTEFKFDVTLSSQTDSKLTKGDFVLTFSVHDSSDVLIHEAIVDGAQNSKPLSFTYLLAKADIPAGRLAFRFDVATSKSGIVHTSRVVTYYFAVPMIASNIAFEGGKGQSYKVGDVVKVSFEPATFPDLRTPHPISVKDGKNGDTGVSRQFYLDVKSPFGVHLHNVKGKPSASGKYSFEIPVDASFDALGVSALSFRYKPSHGDDIVLQSFDSTAGELYEDTNSLSYTVKSDLSFVDIAEQPKAAKLFYGDEVVYKFKVKDSVSGKYIAPSAAHTNAANAFLELQHTDGTRTFTSVSVPAVKDNNGLIVRWTINPNAHRGNGTLSLAVQDADGKKVPAKSAPSHKVEVGGDITVEHHALSTSLTETTSAVFVVELGLFCNKKVLKDAQLRANVVYANSDGSETPLATLPVAHNEGRYTVSWTIPHRDARAGTYRAHFVRETDRAAAQERRDRRLRKEKKEGAAVVEEKEEAVERVFSVEFTHSVARITKLPVKAEFIALVVFGGIVGWLINKRSQLK